MSATFRNKLLASGVPWGTLLAIIPVLVMTWPYRLSGFLVAALMALTLSGFTLENPVDLTLFTSPRFSLGSLFVALSAFVYTVAGGLLLGPLFGTLVNRVASAKSPAEKGG